MDLFGSLVLGLMLAGSAAPTWVGVLGVAAIVASIVILTWQARGAWERRGADELEPEALPPSTTEQPALYEAAAVRDRERRFSRKPRSRVVAHEEPREDVTATVPIPSGYGGYDPDQTAVLELNQPLRRHRR